MQRKERLASHPHRLALVLATALFTAFIGLGRANADDPDAITALQPRFAEESIDFWYTTDSGEMVPGRMFAMYALESDVPPAPLGEFVTTEIGGIVDHAGVVANFSRIGHAWTSGRPPAFVVNTNGYPFAMTQRQALDAILVGADVWRYDQLEFTYAGPTSKTVNAVKPDGQFTVTFGVALPPQAIGVAMLWCPGCQGGPIEYDIQFRLGWAGWTYDQLMSTAAHEFGHVAGLGHETAGCGERTGPVMCPSAGSTFPGADDFAGIRALYGGDGPPPIPQPARYTALMDSFGIGKPSFGHPILAINPATGATCGSGTVKFAGTKAGFSFEVYGAFRSRPGCPQEGGKIRFYFPKTRHWSSELAPWEEGGEFINVSVSTTPANLGYRKRTGAVAGD